MSYGLVVGADVPGAVAERRGKSELLMPCDFMAVHHVMYDMHKSEVYHFPWLLLHSQRLMGLADPSVDYIGSGERALSQLIIKYIYITHERHLWYILWKNIEANSSHS